MTARIGRISAPAVPANFGHFRKNLRLISPHERRSRNMTARIGRISAPAVPANFGHFRKNLRLISPHERRSCNMTAHIVGHFRPPSA